jgi:outer membrane protein assembly factor BamE (lipoprotein component of BamABCDE complex)
MRIRLSYLQPCFTLFSILIFATLLACTSAPLKKFETIRAGMSKSAVVEAAGGPTKTRRWQGKDRWTYEFHDREDAVETREVIFEHGRVTYVGTKLKPSVSAEEQDKLNEATLNEEAARANEIEEMRFKLLGVARVKKVPEDAIDRKIRESYYGVEPDAELEKHKTAPVFVPVE